MIWDYSYYAVKLLCSIAIAALIWRIAIHYINGLRFSGLLAIPLCRLGCLFGLAVVLETLGTAGEFHLLGAVLLPVWLCVATFVALMCSPFLGEWIANPKDLEADQDHVRRMKGSGLFN